MADSTENTEAPKQKKRIREHARDWAGMAAFVTAVAAATAGLAGRGSDADTSKRMSRSVFNALNSQLALMQYRLAVVEQACGVHVPPGFSGRGGGIGEGAVGEMPPHVAERRPAAAMAPDPVEEAPEALRKSPKLNFDAIQRVVESGAVYGPEPGE